MNAQLPPSFWMLDQGAPDADELIVDSFAGGGGASTGIEMALGRSPDFAINHDAEALALHAANHPDTVHLNSNIYQVDPVDVVGRRKVGLLWTSPDCKDFSKAKGGTPVRRHIRGLAWTVVLWIERVRPRVIILENVEEFQQWGPVIEGPKGPIPDPDRRGQTFEEWTAAIRKNGYKVEWKELRACDYGAPTTRKRLFLIARCDGKKIVWPEPTHGPGRLPYQTAASHVIDWTIPCPSIFDTSEDIMAKLGVRAVRPLADNTMARIAKGVKRYVIDAAKPFVIKFQTGAVGADVDSPLPTITANSFIKRPGGAAPLGIVTPHLMTMRNAAKPHNEVDKPTHTVTAGGAGLSLVAPVLSAAQHGGSSRSAGEPVHTLTASPKDQNQVIAAAMVQTGYGEREGQEPRALDIEKPLGTVVAGGAKHAVVAAHLSAYYGPGGGSDDRSSTVDEPIRTVVTENRHAVVAAFMAQHNNDQKPGGGSYPKPGRPVDEPMSTITVTGSQQSVISAGLMNMKGEDRASWPIDGGTPTQTAGGQHIAEVRAFLMKYYGVDQDPRLEEPLSTVTTRDRFGIVTVEGEPYEIVDIGMRMLTPRELFKAQGFPANYEIETGVFEDGSRRPLTKTAQVRMCGNSVCPPIAAALVAANCADMARSERAAAE